jgi:hypothetical protein
MADDAQEIIGKWIVEVKGGWAKGGWTWEYFFSPGGKVTWNDLFNKGENGVGRWSLSPKVINISWSNSSSKESFYRPVNSFRQKGWYDASYYTGEYSMRKDMPAADPPTIGAPGDWFVTGFSGDTLSVVIGAGFTAIKGAIEFSNANGDKVSKGMGIYGPSIGLSYTPNVGKLASKIPGAQALLSKFPILNKIITGSEEKFAERVLLYLWAQSPKMRSAITAYPKLKPALDWLLQNRNAASGGAQSWWSSAIGLVYGKGSAPLKNGDFSGQCVCYALTLAAGPANAGTYVLFFGLDGSWSPVSDPLAFVDLMRIDAKSKGVAIISSASVSLGLPSLSAGATIFWGELR